MLKRRLIPKLQLKRRPFGKTTRMVLVTTVQFRDTIDVGDAVSQAKIYQAQSADELIFVDIDASVENRGNIVDVVRKASEEILMPITVGGGVRSMADVRLLLSNGADKVSINTGAVENPDLINEASAAFGAQCVVIAIDYRKHDDGTYSAWTRSGRERAPLDPVSWAVEAERRGAGEILLTSIDRDGTGKGLDLELTRQVVDRVTVPVITSGGCGLASHFSDAFIKGGADAVSAGSYFCLKDQNPMQARAHIKNSGIDIRLHK